MIIYYYKQFYICCITGDAAPVMNRSKAHTSEVGFLLSVHGLRKPYPWDLTLNPKAPRLCVLCWTGILVVMPWQAHQGFLFVCLLFACIPLVMGSSFPPRATLIESSFWLLLWAVACHSAHDSSFCPLRLLSKPGPISKWVPLNCKPPILLMSCGLWPSEVLSLYKWGRLVKKMLIVLLFFWI